MSKIRASWGDLLLALSGWVTLYFVLHPLGALRALAVFAFTYSCPGLAIVRFVGITDPLERGTLTIAISASSALIVSELLAISHVLTPSSALGVLAAITTGFVLAKENRHQDEQAPQDVKAHSA